MGRIGEKCFIRPGVRIVAPAYDPRTLPVRMSTTREVPVVRAEGQVDGMPAFRTVEEEYMYKGDAKPGTNQRRPVKAGSRVGVPVPSKNTKPRE